MVLLERSQHEGLHKLIAEAASLYVKTQSSLDHPLHKNSPGVSRVKASRRFVIGPVEPSWTKFLDQFRTLDDICQNTPNEITQGIKITSDCGKRLENLLLPIPCRLSADGSIECLLKVRELQFPSSPSKVPV